ncbi:TniQ family protein [Mycobacterium riyadhense]|uniref:TniQ family protein n=1 Tax=Mycobacterium riyadhense TaxID=486698 RepID=UPI00195B576E|nr:TniQ family protein [Mycobacterium riyadhense]
MTLSRRAAQLLPVQVRPVGGETVVSYVFRLADANGFARPTLLLRAIGEPIAHNIHAGILDQHDISLNAPALARLAAMTGRTTTSLRRTLPSLGTACTDRRLSSTTEPLINPFSSAAIRGHCQHCIARMPGHPNIRVHRRSAPAICRRHHRWVDTTGQHPNQVDLANNIEIITAHRRFQRLLSTLDDPTWAHQQLCRTTGIVTQWHHHLDRHSFSNSHFEELHARWDQRARTLPSSGSATPLLVMPEAVTLAEILCDPHWRRHVAIADHYDLPLFYQQVGQRLGQPTKFSDRLAYTHRNDPLKSWVIEHRKRFRALRDQQRTFRTGHPYIPRLPDAILPTNRHLH